MMAIFSLLRLIPAWAWRGLAIAAAISSAAWFMYHKGVMHERGIWEALQSRQAIAIAEQNKRSAEATTRVVTQYVDRVRTVRNKSETITKEVPVYVTKTDDSRCVVNAGFVRVHDSAAANELPASPRGSDEAPASVTLSTVAETVAENYGTCHENAAQLTALQEWVRAQACTTGCGVQK